MYKFILGLDPSGSFHEGKGITGWAIYNVADKRISTAGEIKASKYNCMEAYWDAVVQHIQNYHDQYNRKMILVMEEYLLYASKALAQVNSKMETSKIIGVIQHYCWKYKIPYTMQNASDVKNRWANNILCHEKVIMIQGRGYRLPNSKETLSNHSLDAIRHATHFATFKNK